MFAVRDGHLTGATPASAVLLDVRLAHSADTPEHLPLREGREERLVQPRADGTTTTGLCEWWTR